MAQSGMTFGCVLARAQYGRDAAPEAVRALARRAEALDFDAVWVSDHVVVPRRVASPYPYAAGGASPLDPDQPFLEPLAVLAFLAGCTARVRLGTGVLVVPNRPPVLAAKQLATLDALSGGRLVVGAGPGWQAEEFAVLGAPPFAERGAVTDEYLRLFKALWTEAAPDFRGAYVRVAGVGFAPKPVQRPHPPLWIGGHTPAALRRVAALGDGWMPVGLAPPPLLDPEDLARRLARLRTLLRRAGRAADAVTVSFSAPVAFAPAGAPARPLLQGSPEELAADLRRYGALGVHDFRLGPPGRDPRERLEALERFAREVIPLVRQA